MCNESGCFGHIVNVCYNNHAYPLATLATLVNHIMLLCVFGFSYANIIEMPIVHENSGKEEGEFTRLGITSVKPNIKIY